MNKTAIKNFAIWARNKLIADIKYKAGLLGINEKEIKNALPQSTKDVQFFNIGTKEPYTISGIEIKQREDLAEIISNKAKQSEYKTAYKVVIEEVAYTWFNRLIAIRFMEVNDYLPSRIRVLSSESSTKTEPDIVTTPFDTNLEFTPYEKDRITQLTQENKLDELFRMLFIKQCNELNRILPKLFEKISDYSELLLNISFTDKDGIVNHLVNDIAEEDFTEAVEIIGWMYQYYNEERKNEVINIYKGTIKKEDIPAATQLFTTDWVVRYMVDNSLGRYWIERNPQSKLKDKLEYFVTPKDGQIQYVNDKITPEELTFFDPCMGSGHILVYAFDVLMEIYRESGFADRDAAQVIVERNLFGLDIDDRAYQLAYFAVMIKARSYDRRFLTRALEPNVMAIIETNALSKFTCDGITNGKDQNKVGEYLIEVYKHAKEIGSLISVEEYDYETFIEYLNNCSLPSRITFESDFWRRVIMPQMKNIAKQAIIMSSKYSVVCTNPPYMNKLEGHLKKFVVEEYKPYSGDLFSVFMYRNFDYCRPNGYSAFMTPFVWMFIKTYEKLREYIIQNKSITTLVQMEYSAFEEATVPICSFVLKNGKDNAKGLYFKLSEFKGGMEVQKQKVLEAIVSDKCRFFYSTNEDLYSSIPGMPIAYWINNTVSESFEKYKKLGEYAEIVSGMTTGNNDKYMRDWKEVSFQKIALNQKSLENVDLNTTYWFPYNKGGAFRRWFGNNDFVVNWSKSHEFNRAKTTMTHLYLRRCITWSDITSAVFSARACDYGFFFDVKGSCAFPDDRTYYPLIALLNSKIAMMYIKMLNPTITTQVGDLQRIPFNRTAYDEKVIELAKKCVDIAKKDWDSFEVSWEFTKHPLLLFSTYTIGDAYNRWADITNDRFEKLKKHEEEIDMFFITLYDMQDYIDYTVEDKYVSVRKASLDREIRSFISYAVGCMFGRYSLDLDGLAYAGGEWDKDKYRTFIPVTDNIIPITDEEYLEDDIVGLFVTFVKKVYGEKTTEENLDFIAKALGNKGNTSREVIRNYLMKDFFKDHCKTYQKRPIYWLFDSGKADGFKALIYMHRYDENTVGNLRIDYLHKIQRVYDSEIARMQEIIDNGSGREVTQAEKRKEKLVKQLKETKEFDEKIAHLALSRISIDLDDGVKVNYEKVQTGTDGKKLEVLAKI